MCYSTSKPFVSFTPEQRFLVTGASSGIGACITQTLCRLGATVIASGRNTEHLEAVRTNSSAPENIHIEPKDLIENIEELPNWVSSLAKKYGKLSGFIHSAGIVFAMPLQLLDKKKMDAMFAINYFTPLFLAKGFCDHRNNTGEGSSVLFLASAVIGHPQRSQSVYASSKAALAEAAKCISLEYSKYGIRINSISPADIKTPLLENYYKTELGITNYEEIISKKYSLGLGKVEDVAGLVAFLLSDNARWITGQNYYLDGGFQGWHKTW